MHHFQIVMLPTRKVDNSLMFRFVFTHLSVSCWLLPPGGGHCSRHRCDDLLSEFHGHRFLYSQRMVRWDNYKFIFNAHYELKS